jgi:uncharacterized coiled-coil protein SlyX
MVKLNGAITAVKNSLIAMVVGALLVWLIQTVRADDVRRIEIVEIQNMHQDSSIARLNTIVASELSEFAKTRTGLEQRLDLIMEKLKIPDRMKTRSETTR